MSDLAVQSSIPEGWIFLSFLNYFNGTGSQTLEVMKLEVLRLFGRNVLCLWFTLVMNMTKKITHCVRTSFVKCTGTLAAVFFLESKTSLDVSFC